MTDTTNTKLTRFTKAGVLIWIGHKNLITFLEQFKEDFAVCNAHLPGCDPSGDGYYATWAEFLKTSETLPARFVEALLAVEELAAPENRQRLEAAVYRARHTGLHLDTTNSPESLALQFWLWAPYRNFADLESIIESRVQTFKEEELRVAAADGTVSATQLATPEPTVPASTSSPSTSAIQRDGNAEE